MSFWSSLVRPVTIELLDGRSGFVQVGWCRLAFPVIIVRIDTERLYTRFCNGLCEVRIRVYRVINGIEGRRE